MKKEIINHLDQIIKSLKDGLVVEDIQQRNMLLCSTVSIKTFVEKQHEPKIEIKRSLSDESKLFLINLLSDVITNNYDNDIGSSAEFQIIKEVCEL